jgi:hypothetical protein
LRPRHGRRVPTVCLVWELGIIGWDLAKFDNPRRVLVQDRPHVYTILTKRSPSSRDLERGYDHRHGTSDRTFQFPAFIEHGPVGRYPAPSPPGMSEIDTVWTLRTTLAHTSPRLTHCTSQLTRSHFRRVCRSLRRVRWLRWVYFRNLWIYHRCRRTRRYLWANSPRTEILKRVRSRHCLLAVRSGRVPGRAPGMLLFLRL